MSPTQNRFGLSRSIPEAIKREVRRRDGFGCVVCGFALCDYEHLDPEFSEAREHTVEGICLLCPRCHASKGAFLSRSTIVQAAKRPKAKQTGWSHGAFDVGNGHPEIVVGSALFRYCETVLEILGEKVLSIKLPEELWGPFRIDAELRDRSGAVMLAIKDNVFETPMSNWDVDATRGNDGRITIRSAPRNIDLVLRPQPPGRLFFEQINISHRGTRIWIGAAGRLEVKAPDGSRISVQGTTIIGCSVGFRIEENSVALGCAGPPPAWMKVTPNSPIADVPYLRSYFDLLREQQGS